MNLPDWFSRVFVRNCYPKCHIKSVKIPLKEKQLLLNKVTNKLTTYKNIASIKKSFQK
jgi:hypothetical protein